MQIIVQNKQRQHKLELKKIQTMVQELSQAVLANLSANKPNWLSAKILAEIQKHASLSLIIVSPLTIKKLNKQWLNNDRVTDVLSFPLYDLSTLKSAKQTHSAISEPASTDPWQLGEVFIAYEIACQQALEYNHSIEREFAFLFVHGLLHILGFDHQDKASEADMFGRQKRILHQSGYRR